MKLLNLEAKNVFSLGDISLDLKDRGLTLITGYSEDEQGNNGAGKSSIANKSILWGLYGESAGGIKADAVLNRHGKRRGRVRVTFQGVDGDEYRITRERPAKLILERRINTKWRDVSSKTAKDTQTAINKVLGIDFKTFVQTSFFGQGRKLSYVNLTPKEQKIVLEQILPMEDVDLWAERADKHLKEVNKKVNSVKERANHRKEQLRIYTLERDRTKTNADEFKKNQARRITELQEKLEASKVASNEKHRQLETLNQQINSTDESELNRKWEKIQTEIDERSNKISFEMRQNITKAKTSFDQWKTRQKYLANEIQELERSTACPTCLRPYDGSESIRQRIQNTEALISEAEANSRLAFNALTYYEKKCSDANIEVKLLQTKRDQLGASLRQINEKKREALTLETQINAEEGRIKDQIAYTQNEKNPYEKDRARLDATVDNCEKLWKEAEFNLGIILGEQEHLDYWRTVYAKELKLKLFEDACPFLDNRTKYHLERLKNGQIHAEFSTVKRLAIGKVKEEFNVNVWSETGGLGIDSLSGGEQEIVNFAVGLALSDLAASVSSSHSEFLILDEPFSQLDARNSESVVEYLTSEVNKNTIFLISNEEPLKGLIPNRIHIIKSRGVSRVV